MKKNELNKNVILNEDAVKNIHCDEITLSSTAMIPRKQ